jgi:glycosidase
MKHLPSLLLVAFTLAAAQAQTLSRVEPPSWWTGMKHPLQLMFYGNDLANASVSVSSPDMLVRQVHKADNPSYLFVDVDILPSAKAGVYTFTLEKAGKKLTHPYTLHERRTGAAEREGFSSKDVVYLLMPDRFAQGDPSKPNPLKGKVDRADDYARHGGDIQGIIDHLDYLADLGITALWSTPLTEDNEEQVSYHGYACSDYYKIDPRYGTNDLYKKMVEAAHQKGIKIIKDMVPNHCGTGHWWMKEPPFATWVNHYPQYVQTNNVQFTQVDPYASAAERTLHTSGWFVQSMPDMNLTNPYVLTYFSQMAIWWIEWANLDGLRVDTYPYSDKHAIAEWTQRILREYPHLNIVGECWVLLPAFTAYWQGNQPKHDGYASHLPSVMDFSLRQALTEALQQGEVSDWYRGMMNVYMVLAQDFLYENPNSLLTFVDNHDGERFPHFTQGSAKKQMLALTMLATMRGIPQLLYGTEQLLQGKPHNGFDGQRVDFPGGWIGDSINLFAGKGRTSAQDSVYRHTRLLLGWRKNVGAIHSGKTTHFFPAPPANIYAYARHTSSELVLVVVNPNAAPRTLDWPHYAELFDGYTQGIEVISGKPITPGEELVVGGEQAVVIHFKI